MKNLMYIALLSLLLLTTLYLISCGGSILAGALEAIELIDTIEGHYNGIESKVQEIKNDTQNLRNTHKDKKSLETIHKALEVAHHKIQQALGK